MRKLFGMVALLLVGASGIVLAAAKLESGLPVGEEVPAFNVRDVTGPAKGTTLCYACRYGSRPVVAIFAREVNGSVKELVAKIDEKVGANKDKKMAAFVVVLTEDPDGVEPKLETLVKEAKISNTPLTIVEGVTGPPDYRLSMDAEVTVLMWVGSQVKVNQAFAKGKLDKKAVDELVAETKKILQ
jgi:hypothetical protein